MKTRLNKAIVQRFMDTMYNQGALESAAEFFTPDAIHHALDQAAPGFRRGPRAVAEFIELYRSAFPDLRVTIEDQVAEGDQVTTRWRLEGTHSNPLMGIAASGQWISVTGIQVDRLADGKIAESWLNWNVLEMLSQIGALPALNRRPPYAAAPRPVAAAA